MSVLFAVVCVVMCVAGVAKIVEPTATAGTLAVLQAPAPRVLTRLLGVTEVGVGGAGLAVGGSVAATAIAAMYLAFAVFVLVVRRRGDVTTCGCFGMRATPPSLLHVAINLVSGLVAAVAAGHGVGAVADTLADAPLGGVPLLALVILGAIAVVAAETLLPDRLRRDRLDGAP